MHLHHQAGAQVLASQPGVHVDHRQLDQVGGRALHGGVDGGALGHLAAPHVGRPDLGQPQPTAKHGLDVALFTSLGAGALHVGGHAGITREVAVNVGLCRATLDTQVGGQAEGAHAVDEPEVDHLGIAALLAVDLCNRHAEDFGCRGAVHVLTVGEGLQQPGILRDVRHDAQLDLRVVGRHHPVARRRNEGFADASPFRGAHRDVLQVRVAGGQPAGDGHRL